MAMAISVCQYMNCACVYVLNTVMCVMSVCVCHTEYKLYVRVCTTVVMMSINEWKMQ